MNRMGSFEDNLLVHDDELEKEWGKQSYTLPLMLPYMPLENGLVVWQQAARNYINVFPEIRRINQLILETNATPKGVLWLDNARRLIAVLDALSLRGAKKALQCHVGFLRNNLNIEIDLLAPVVAKRIREQTPTNIRAWLDEHLPKPLPQEGPDPNKVHGETEDLRKIRRACILWNFKSDEAELGEIEREMEKPLKGKRFWCPTQMCHVYTEVAKKTFPKGDHHEAYIDHKPTVEEQKAAYIRAVFDRVPGQSIFSRDTGNNNNNNNNNDNNDVSSASMGRTTKHSFLVFKDGSVMDVTYNQFFPSKVESWPPIFHGTKLNFQNL